MKECLIVKKIIRIMAEEASEASSRVSVSGYYPTLHKGLEVLHSNSLEVKKPEFYCCQCH